MGLVFCHRLMKWTRGQESEYIDDRRGQRARWGGRVGVGTVVLALLAFVAQRYLGVDLGIGSGDDRGGQSAPIDPASDPDREMVDFMKFVINDLQATWTSEFAEIGKTYRPARLALYNEATSTACGYGTAAIGPFYCPGDEEAFIDLSFFRQLRDRFGAPGDFAQAYVLAHEIGHHVQNLLGYEDAMRTAQRRDPERKNDLSVRFELQADCLAGVWGHSTQQRKVLEAGDVEEGLRAAAAIGDDTLQKQSGGRVSPESWTHGSSEQRVRWLRRGLETGSIAACETARADPL
jgi:predicted metalloprotease